MMISVSLFHSPRTLLPTLYFRLFGLLGRYAIFDFLHYRRNFGNLSEGFSEHDEHIMRECFVLSQKTLLSVLFGAFFTVVIRPLACYF